MLIEYSKLTNSKTGLQYLNFKNNE